MVEVIVIGVISLLGVLGLLVMLSNIETALLEGFDSLREELELPPEPKPEVESDRCIHGVWGADFCYLCEKETRRQLEISRLQNNLAEIRAKVGCSGKTQEETMERLTILMKG